MRYHDVNDPEEAYRYTPRPDGFNVTLDSKSLRRPFGFNRVAVVPKKKRKKKKRSK